MQKPRTFDDEVLRCLHEVAEAAREVPAESQTPRLQNALTSLVALDVFSAGTYLPPTFEPPYAPGAPPSS
jgi:hypothetical protein